MNKKVLLVRIKKLSWQVLDQWYKGHVASGTIRKVVETYCNGIIEGRCIDDNEHFPIPECHYTVLRELLIRSH